MANIIGEIETAQASSYTEASAGVYRLPGTDAPVESVVRRGGGARVIIRHNVEDEVYGVRQRWKEDEDELVILNAVMEVLGRN